jgi:hypothetical protein
MNTLEERLELGNDAANKMRQLMEKWKGRLTLDNLRLTERYLKGGLEILVHIRPELAAYSADLCAVLKHFQLPARQAGTGRAYALPLLQHTVGFEDFFEKFRIQGGGETFFGDAQLRRVSF